MKRLLLLTHLNESLVFSLKALLQSSITNIDSAKTVDEAMVLFRINQYSSLITDLGFGRSTEDSLETIKTIKAIQPECKIIIMDLFGEETNEKEALKYGADFYLDRPSAIKEIINILHTLGL